MIFKNISLLNETADTNDTVEWLKQHPHWCIKPFQTIHISHSSLSSGESFTASPCCNFGSNYFNAKVPLTTLKQQFSPLKETIINGVKNESCRICYNTEKTNIFSERVREVMQLPPHTLNNFLTTNKLNEYTIGIKFGNLCNLACRSCDGSLSTTYAKVVNDVTKYDQEITNDIPQWNDLLNYVQTALDTYELVHVGLIGGETMLQPGARQFTEELAKFKKSNNIVLRITSNFTTLDNDILKHIDKFRRLDLTASIDSTGENYHYVRWPAKFNKIKENIQQYQNIRRNSSTLTTFTIASVFSLNNIFYIEEYIDFLQECIGQQHDTMINVLHLNNPEWLSIENLPQEYRPHLLAYVQRALQKRSLNFTGLYPMKVFLQGIEEFLTSNTNGIGNFDKFLNFTADFDQRTNCYMSQFNNRLYDILSHGDKVKYQSYFREQKQ